MKKALAALLLVLAWLAPISCYAGNGVSGITLQVSRNLTSVGIRAIVSGDDDSSAVLRIYQSPYANTGGAYDSGMVMVRRPGFPIHVGRILWMTQGRTAYFKVRAEDALGAVETPWDTVSCAEVRRRPSGGTVVYVNQATGVNTNNGLTPATPKRTFNTTAEGTGALAQMLAFNTNGSGIIVAPGEYHEKLSINSGTDGFFHFIAGDGTNPDSTIICGANLHGEAGRYDISNNLSWVARPIDATTLASAHNVYKTYLPAATSVTAFGDSIGSVTFGWGEFLHKKTSIAAVYADSSGTASNANLSVGLVGHGWYWIADTLYVKRPGGATPTGAVLHAGYLGALIDVAKRNYRISGLTIRFAGGPIAYTACPGTCTADEDPDNASWEGIVFGRNANASGGVVDSCRFYGNQGPGVYARYTSAGLVADSCTIANSTFDGLTIGSSGYGASKGRLEENSGGPISVGLNSNVFNNTVREVANGIQLGPVAAGVDSTWGSNTEVAYNRIYQGADDGIETDTGAGINELILGNTTDGGSSGISVAPLYIGPMWVLYNTFTRFVSAGIKIGFDGDGQTYFYQNTMVSKEPGSRAFEGGSGGYYKSVAANNIFWGEVGIHGLSSSAQDIIDSANVVATFNYNCTDSTTGRLIDRWNGSDNQNWYWWQAHGNEANGQFGDPGLVNLTRGRSLGNLPNARPRHSNNFAPSSIVIGRGRRLPGINYGLQGPRWAGSAPNIGAQGCYNCYYPEP